MTTTNEILMMNYETKEDIVTDLFANIIYRVAARCSDYSSLTSDEKVIVRVEFFDALNNEMIELDKNFVTDFHIKNMGSDLNSILTSYVANNEVAEIHTVAAQLNDIEGEKVTLLYSDEFGYPCVTHTRILKASVESYAQYSDALYIAHIPKRKRSAYKVNFLPHQKIAIYTGWQPVSKEQMSISKYRSFDDRFLNNIIKELGEPDIKY